MRTTIDLPDDMYDQAQQEAARRGLDVNQFISSAVTKMLQATMPAAPTSTRYVEFPIIKRVPDAPLITKEMVDLAEDQMLKEEAEHFP